MKLPWQHSPKIAPEAWLSEIVPLQPLPLFRPLTEWSPAPPQLSISEYERRKSMRELDMAFSNRVIALRRHHFE